MNYDIVQITQSWKESSKMGVGDTFTRSDESPPCSDIDLGRHSPSDMDESDPVMDAAGGYNSDESKYNFFV